MMKACIMIMSILVAKNNNGLLIVCPPRQPLFQCQCHPLPAHITAQLGCCVSRKTAQMRNTKYSDPMMAPRTISSRHLRSMIETITAKTMKSRRAVCTTKYGDCTVTTSPGLYMAV
mmetsp:Transcript_4913/g.10738  ORF Transcript_4913/g.10738 Transcript_4913/m.10738 type:complete len:116 (-) Transcript_4913:426-773(-)